MLQLYRLVNHCASLNVSQLKKIEVAVFDVPKNCLASDQSFLQLNKLFSQGTQVNIVNLTGTEILYSSTFT